MTGANDAGTTPRLDATERRVRRLRILVHDNFAAAVVALVVVALLGGYFTYATYAAPGTTTETRTVSTWESSGEFSHRATVVNGTDAFERGAVLRNRSVYFQRVAPTLDGRFAYEYAASDGGSLTVTVETVAVVRSVSTGGEGGATEHWRVERPLNRERVDSVAPGERVTVPFSVNVSAVSERARRIERQLGASPGHTEVNVTSRVTVAGTRNGQPVEETRRYHLPIEPGVGVYHVEEPDPDALTDSDRTTERVTVQRSYGPVRRLGAPLLFAVGVGGIAALGVARRRDALAVSPADRERLAATAARAEFDDWITRARVPASARENPAVPVDSLEGLVDVAVDTDARVVEDRGRGEFVVLGDAVTYVYRSEDPQIGDAGATGPDPLAYSDESPSPGDVTSAEAAMDGRENGGAPTRSADGANPDGPERGPTSDLPSDRVEDTEPNAGENVAPSPTELLPEDRATVDASPEPDASGQAADDPGSEQSADDASADDAVETVSVPSLAVDGHPGIYHENDGADTDGWPEDRNLAGRSPSDD